MQEWRFPSRAFVNSKQHTPDIAGAATVVEVLGHWPSFHDAEIVRLHLERDGVSTISIRLATQQGVKGSPVVTFTMDRISDLTLDGEDINRQNVIFDLAIEETENGTRLILSPCYGLSGRITAERVSAEMNSD